FRMSAESVARRATNASRIQDDRGEVRRGESPPQNKMFGLFIAGTGTDVGKTVVATALLCGLRSRRRGGYWKPVSSGRPCDSATVAEHAKQQVIAPRYSYMTPASPHVAARLDGKPAVDIPTLCKHWHTLQQQENYDLLLIEAAGGMCVPLNDELQTWFDFLLQTPELQTILVASSGLGTLNHTALTLEAFQQRGINVHAIILSGEQFHDNAATMQRRYPDVPLISFAHCENLSNSPDWQCQCDELAQKLLTTLQPANHNAQRPDAWLTMDRQHVWHPFTRTLTAEAIVSASGVWLQTASGQRMIDGIASWWTCNIGHGRPEIAAACAEQLRTCDHVAFAALTHEPAARLAHKVAKMTADLLPRVFFSDNGSSAVEIAAKIAFQLQQQRGLTKKCKFLTVEAGYHGDTIGAMALGSFTHHRLFSPLLFETLRIKPATSHASPVCPQGKEALAAYIADLKQVITTHADNLCAVIVEPLLQGAGGMLVQEERWLQELVATAQAHDVLVIFDEVFTACGRVGFDFAFQRASVKPDIVCVAKGLTGGSIPLALTLTTAEIFDAFSDQPLMHGHTFTANPTACRVALQALHIYQRERLAARALRLEKKFNAWRQRHNPPNSRSIGAMLAFNYPNMNQDKRLAVAALAAQHRLYLRPLGDTVYFVPPLSITDAELDIALHALEKICETII
ncbi:MAG: adenosylmethionine--8-amino-7-oxononanoate transaminase, partial [Pseudomonadota bacterium]|nr:adenosylmethionine--8-amino-7-oxononanoate transaminase [Pseudomonadota bacterium]